MPIPAIQFDPPYDIHIQRGQSVDLLPLLKIDNDLATDHVAANSNISFVFEGIFDGTSTGSNYSGHNITLNTTTGHISTQQTAPVADQEKYNFIVIARVSDSADASTEDTHVRVHVHSTINEVWLSPDKLTVYQGLSDFKMTVRAKFSDGIVAVIGNVYNEEGILVNYNHTPAHVITWSSPLAGLVDATGSINPTAAMAKGEHDISIQVSIFGSNLNHTGKVIISDNLSAGSVSIKANLVASGACPGIAKLDEVPNILFLADGFRDQEPDRSSFSKMVNNFVNELVSGKISSPFDKLKGSINYWMALVPSRQTGVTTRRDIFVHEANSKVSGYDISIARKNDSSLDAEDWKYYHLYYHCGLPVRADVEKSVANIRTYWKNTTRLTDAQIDAIDENVIKSWRIRGQRRLPEERDTAFGIMVNNYSTIDKDSEFRDLGFHPHRVNRVSIDPFIAGMKDAASNTVIGHKFRRTSPQGADFDRIVFLSSGITGRENNFYGGFFTLVNTRYEVKPVEGTMAGFKASINPENTIEKIPIDAKATLIHELGHSFYLGDEYGESSRKYRNKFTDQVGSWGFNKYDDSSSDLDEYGNIVSREDLLTAGNIDPLKLKWRYHRIKKAGVLTAVPTINASNEYTITLKAGQADIFDNDDIVLLRKSNKSVPVSLLDRTAPSAADRPNESDQIVRFISREMKVVDASAGANQIRIKSTDVNNLNLHNRFTDPIASDERVIIYSPVKKPDSVTLPEYKYAEVISEKVLKHLISTPRAFNTKNDSGTFKEYIDDDAVQHTTIPGSVVPSCSSQKHKIIGLYAGGKRHHCHVYHGSGRCIMRTQYHDKTFEKFCEVCKYVIVDYINPTKHPELDKEIGGKKIYQK